MQAEGRSHAAQSHKFRSTKPGRCVAERSSATQASLCFQNMHLRLSLSAVLGVLAATAATAAPPDYIVVGSGPGGCTVAARLCARLPSRQIVLLERGPAATSQNDKLTLSAVRNSYVAQRSRFVQPIQTTANPGLNGRKVTVLAGNALGGLSSVNAGQWTVPPPADPASWGFRGLTPLRARLLYARAAAQTRARTPRPALRQALASAWLAAAARAGIQTLRRPPGPRRANVAYNGTLTIDRAGRRQDACTAYLTPVQAGRCRNNLRVIQGATVTKLLLTGPAPPVGPRAKLCRGPGKPKKRVTGVEYVLGNSAGRKTLNAARGVILSAGPIGSAQVLMQSGVGPGLAHPLPVGQGVSSRVVATVVSAYQGIPTVADNVKAAVRSAAERANFLAGRGGLLGRAISAINGRFGKEFYFLTTNSFDLDDPNAANLPLLLSGCLGAASPIGSITLSGSNPLAKPTLNLKYLGGAGDAVRLAVCLRKLREVHQQLDPSLAAAEVRPGPAVPVINEQAVRENARVAFHIVGSNSVGKVVDGQFRVKGLDGIRVVDSSVIPRLPRQAGPMSSVYMLGELASSLIVRDDRRCW